MTKIITNSTEETISLAKSIGQALSGGEVFELISDVGGGKTTFTKGLAQGLDIEDTVQSPTYTISRIYKARDDLELHHFDFYRLEDAGVVAAELIESLQEPNSVVAIEWGDIVHDVLPEDKVTIKITSTGDQAREVEIISPEKYSRIQKALS